YEDYSSVTIESMYYDTTIDFDPNAHVHYNFTTQYPNNRIMYRLNRWMRYMNRGEAKMIEAELRDRFGFTIDQIAELSGHHINPEMLVSLIAPKLGVVEFFGKYHYVAGNYLPSILNEKYQVYVPRYNGSDCLIPIETQVEETTETAEMYHV
ncbi:NAD(P)H-hydrate epimerase-like, partial [Diaphorina citri]|uniref:NAD(P)H-hydrate epimerase-like n=1 Tax=Diaphorina citri TaxID=121845 RepID=A0A1S4EQ34_DIACI